MRNASRTRSIMTLTVVSAAFLQFGTHALALSDGSMAPAAGQNQVQESAPLPGAFGGTILPRPGTALENDAAQNETPEASGADEAVTPDAAEPSSAEIIRDLSSLPAPVKEMREKIVEAAASGDIERLRPLLQDTPKPPQIMNGESDDPIETLKNFSGDPDGQEILAIMLDILSSGVARIDAGTPEEVYVWPYFVGKPLTSLTAPERVELLRIVTAGDLIGMEENGNYNFYRLGISPDGQWKFMTGGD
jgi:hypothetical protein